MFPRLNALAGEAQPISSSCNNLKGSYKLAGMAYPFWGATSLKLIMGVAGLKNYVAWVPPLDVHCVLPGGTFDPTEVNN